MIIKRVVKLQNGTVMVFDADGEQIPEYQGQYGDVWQSILKDAPLDAVFTHWFGYDTEPQIVSREEW